MDGPFSTNLFGSTPNANPIFGGNNIFIGVHNYVSSSIRYSDQSAIPLKVDTDPICNKMIADLFVKYAEDYTLSFGNISQIPRNGFDSGHESEWSEFVRSMVDHPTSIVFVRQLSHLFANIQLQLQPTPEPNLLQPQLKQEQLQLHQHLGQHLQQQIEPLKPLSWRSRNKDICEHPKCNRVANWNYPGQTGGKFCNRHRDEAMIHVDQKMCETPNCTRLARFNFAGEMERRFCEHHKLPGMARISYWFCFQPDCRRKAYYNLPGEKIGKFCTTHRTEGMINVAGAFCSADDCYVYASYSYPGELRATHCATHHLPGMVAAVRMNKCKAPGCEGTGRYGEPGRIRGPKFCEIHKTDGMVILRKKGSCCYKTCTKKNATYHFEGDPNYYCFEHKQDGMIPRKRKIYICQHLECNEVATCRFKNEALLRFCDEHRVEGMIMTRKCRERGCPKDADYSHYSYEGQPNRRYCAEHKKPGMLHFFQGGLKKCRYGQCQKTAVWASLPDGVPELCNIHKTEGMTHVGYHRNSCVKEGCNIIAKYGPKGADKKEATHCCMHRLEGMVHLTAKKCEFATCDEEPTFGFVGQTRRFCADHHLEGMVERRRKIRCEVEGCNTVPSFNYPSEQGRKYCVVHKEEGMVNKREPKGGKRGGPQPCEMPDCSEVATHNFSGKRKRRFCEAHKLPNMVRKKPAVKKVVEEVYCELDTCRTVATYGYPADQKKTRCVEHKLEGMDNARVKKKRGPKPKKSKKARGPAKKAAIMPNPKMEDIAADFDDSEEEEMELEEEVEESEKVNVFTM